MEFVLNIVIWFSELIVWTDKFCIAYNNFISPLREWKFWREIRICESYIWYAEWLVHLHPYWGCWINSCVLSNAFNTLQQIKKLWNDMEIPFSLQTILWFLIEEAKVAGLHSLEDLSKRHASCKCEMGWSERYHLYSYASFPSKTSVHKGFQAST